ncbi:hypothetical protein EDC94DRAFT_106659 [Helicostylum pulchrum]|uniref:Uncharacterized protein n=1 Tax=Helicostylum pulchrum TaxID=562976 RepID=A0ABP9Y4Q3_9FUNG|nr:hypothetical protein EDC94DRAFT_106659 [Helicostylum pulchrum]
MKLLYITLTYISITFASEYALINCSWPCPNISHGCIVSPQEAHCGQRRGNSWIINTPQKAPYYTGAYISVHLQPCQPAPTPYLPPATLVDNRTEPGQSIILWPIDNIRRPHDIYLGNCGHGYYCSSAGSDSLYPVCRHRVKETSSCESSNQCTTSFCHEHTCQLNIDGNITEKNERWNRTHDHKDRTAQILASVFGIVGGIVMLGIAFIVYRKHKSKKKEETAVYYNTQNNSGLPLQQEQFASDFQHDITQSQLHDMAQSQLHVLERHNSVYSKPPPSYKP